MFLIISSFFVHTAFLISVFDIYFKSPVVHDIKPQSSPLEAPARMLVLMVTDGLLTYSFLGPDGLFKANASDLRYIIEERGAWGVSHTRVPTESRPALIAGLYEDPSAVAKIVASEKLIALSLLGLNYYQNYYQRPLLTCVTLAFLGWITWLLHSLVGDDSSHKKSPSFLHVLHDEVYQEHELLTFTHFRPLRWGCWVVSFFYHSFLRIGMLGIAVWPIVFSLAQPVHLPFLAGWLTCLFLAVFALLPVIGREPNTQLVTLSCWLFLV